MIKRKAYILFSVLLLAGCYDDFIMPVVVSASPGRNENSVDQDASVSVRFSKKMDTMKTSNEFTLSSSSGAVNGYFSWGSDDTVMSFRAAEPLKRAEKYTIRITDAAEDSEGNDLDEEFISSFYTGGDIVQPEIDSFLPGANSIGNAADTVVTVVFSEPMDPDTIYEGLSVSPAAEGYYEWSADRTTALFRPLYGFNYGVTYTATVSRAMKDAAGNSITEEESFSFTLGDDFIPPELTVYQDNAAPLPFDENQQVSGAEKDGNIVIDFSEVVVTDIISDSISITPAGKFYITTSTVVSGGVNITRAVINFTENLESEEIYTLRIGSSITDLQHNSLSREYRYVFVTDGHDSICPLVLQIGELATIESAPWTQGEIVIMGLENASDNFFPDIAVNFNSVIDPLSLEITIDLTAGYTGVFPEVVNINWPQGPPEEKFTRLTFGLYNVSPGKTYIIRIKGGTAGLKDRNGNYMKDDFLQIIKFN